MKKHRFGISIFHTGLVAFTLVGACKIQAQVVCDKFTILTKLNGSSLELAVDTDLPGSTMVMVSVSRSYLEKGNSSTYSCDYLSKKSTIGEWKTKSFVSLDNGEWRKKLKNKQIEMSRLGLGFDVESIGNEVEVRMVVPIEQPNPKFGKDNLRLTGSRVRMRGIRVVEDEVKIHYPIDSSSISKSPIPSLDPQNLDIGQSYILSKKTPLMPSIDPTDPLNAIEQMKQIPAGGVIKVYEIQKKRETPWYRVTATDHTKNMVGSGWINSSALLGQQLEAHRE